MYQGYFGYKFFLFLCPIFFIGAISSAVALPIKDNENTALEKIIVAPEKYDKVKIKGVVLHRINFHTYIVQDGAAVVKVVLPFDLLPEKGLYPRDSVSLEGEVETTRENETIIDVDQIFFSF